MLPISCNLSIVELFDPFGRDIGSFPKGDGERWVPRICDVPLRGFDKGLLIVEEMGLSILEVFLQLVDGHFVLLGLNADLLLIVLMAAVRSFDKGIDNGMECGWIQVGGGDGIAD